MRNSYRTVLVAMATLRLLRSADMQTLTVAELRSFLQAEHHADESDKRLAEQISRTQLSERLSNAVLEQLRRGEGAHTQSALQFLADESAFLPPPASEVLSVDPPSLGEQQELLSKASTYARAYVHSLPDFQCRKLTRRFDDDVKRQITNAVALLPGADTNAWKTQASAGGNRHLTERDWTIEDVTFRNSHDVYSTVQVSSSQPPQPNLLPSLEGLRTSGEFGGLMASLFSRPDRVTFAWHHWETEDGKRIAVFSYRVGLRDSRFSINWCCVNGKRIEQMVAYAGELSFDTDGAIQRLWWQAQDIPEQIPTRASKTAVDYGPVSIGGVTYELPIRSVTVTVTRDPSSRPTANLYIRSLNQIEFSDYHKFGSESHLVVH